MYLAKTFGVDDGPPLSFLTGILFVTSCSKQMVALLEDVVQVPSSSWWCTYILWVSWIILHLPENARGRTECSAQNVISLITILLTVGIIISSDRKRLAATATMTSRRMRSELRIIAEQAGLWRLRGDKLCQVWHIDDILFVCVVLKQQWDIGKW